MTIKSPLLTHHKHVMEEALQSPEFKALWKAGATRREIIKTIIGERIRRKMSQRELAEKAGLRQPNIARIESGRVAVTIDTLNKIAKVFGKGLEIRFT